jgi:KaiC/GvpD/RAD55 family RecA-like ATPase
VERVQLGVSEIDQPMLGGLPRGSLILVIGPPGAGKSILSKLFLYKGAQDDETPILLSTSEEESTIRETFRLFNWASSVEGRLVLIDCYSWRAGKPRTKFSASLTSLTEVSLAISGALESIKGNGRFVLDSFSDFVKYAGIDRSIRFLDSARTKLKQNGVTGMILLEEGMHAPRTVTSVEYSTDGTIRMRFAENGRYMMVSRMVATPVMPKWIPFVIGK